MMKARLEILLAQIDEQIKVIEEQHRTHVKGYLPEAKEIGNVFFNDEESVYAIRLEDGSYPLVPLLVAKAQVLHALTMIQATEIS